MNREQRRMYAAKLQKAGYSRDDIKKLMNIQEQEYEYLQEGQKVKLDYERITSYKDYDRLTDKYRNWIETNKDKIFTVEYDEGKKDKPMLVCFKEDITTPKWLFHDFDLIRVEE